jgi:hypothetical protein
LTSPFDPNEDEPEPKEPELDGSELDEPEPESGTVEDVTGEPEPEPGNELELDWSVGDDDATFCWWAFSCTSNHY